MGEPQKGYAEAVRAAASALGECSIADIARARPDIPRGNIRVAMKDFAKSGEAEKIGRARYRYVGPSSYGTVAKKIYRAIHITGAFEKRQIAMLSGGSITRVTGIVRILEAAGEVEKTGSVRPASGTGRLWRYRVRHRDEFYLKYVKGGA